MSWGRRASWPRTPTRCAGTSTASSPKFALLEGDEQGARCTGARVALGLEQAADDERDQRPQGEGKDDPDTDIGGAVRLVLLKPPTASRSPTPRAQSRQADPPSRQAARPIAAASRGTHRSYRERRSASSRQRPACRN